MTTLREAVKAVLDCWDSPEWGAAPPDLTGYLMEALRAALEQQAEPVAWAVYDAKHGGSKTLHWPEQHSPHGDPEHFNAVPLYTSPPQRKPLTGSVLVPLEILEAAEGSLGSFCSDEGWGDVDMRNMDNLSAYIAQHKAAHGIGEKP